MSATLREKARPVRKSGMDGIFLESPPLMAAGQGGKEGRRLAVLDEVVMGI
jgi:hypothetical protein